MKISSPVFTNNSDIPQRFTCMGENISPPLSFEDVPLGAKSLALIVDDPDAPSKTFVHWVVYNILPNTTNIVEDSVPEGSALGFTDFGRKGYGGPCPPSGTHRYFFKLYALDTMLHLPVNPNKDDVLEVMKGHILQQGELIGQFEKP